MTETLGLNPPARRPAAVTIRVTPARHRQIQDAAARHGVVPAQLCRFAVERFLAELDAE